MLLPLAVINFLVRVSAASQAMPCGAMARLSAQAGSRNASVSLHMLVQVTCS